MSLLFKNYLHVEVMYLLIICNENKLFPWNTKNTDGNGVYKQNIQMHTKHSKITLEIVSMKISDTPFLKTTQPRLPHFTNPSLFIGKICTPPFLWKFWKLKSPLFARTGGSQLGHNLMAWLLPWLSPASLIFIQKRAPMNTYQEVSPGKKFNYVGTNLLVLFFE